MFILCSASRLKFFAGPRNAVHLPKPVKKKVEHTIDELSTLPEGKKICVKADGKVFVIDENSKYLLRTITELPICDTRIFTLNGYFHKLNAQYF